MGWATLVTALFLVGCGGDSGGGGDDAPNTLEDFLPELPVPTGESQTVFAGQVTSADELIPGDAAHGMVGDFFIRNSKARFIVQSEARVIGVVPPGGNLIDAALLDDNGNDVTEDHFGELSSIYLVGRTCEHEAVEVLLDGSGGGAAVIRATGKSNINDFFNLQGIGLLSIPPEIDPDVGDDIECATTYVLFPDEPVLHVAWTFFNPGEFLVEGPFGAFADTGGETEVFAPTRGFERAGIEALTTLTEPSPIDYVVYQGPGVAYGIVPTHDGSVPNSQVAIAGVSVLLYGADALLDILNDQFWYFQAPPNDGVTHTASIVVARDSAGVEEVFRGLRDLPMAEVSGTVAFTGGELAPGARVGLYEDVDSDGVIGDDDQIRAYMDPDATGAFSGRVAPGNYLVRAEVKNVAKSATQAVEVAASGTSGVAIELPAPVVFDYTIRDVDTGNTIPGRIVVIGDHPAFPDLGLFETADRLDGVVTMIPAAYGTSVDVGDGANEPLVLPPGTYRVFATHGTEWSVDFADVSPVAGDTPSELVFDLKHVAPTPGYLATEFHQHSIGSPDSPVSRQTRLFSFVAEGVEFFASTDHDFVSDFGPVIQAAGLSRFVHAIPGIEVTPFVYGHFQAFPLTIDNATPNGGAIDWPRGTAGFAMIPSEIWDTARNRGAEVIQVNHPRATSNDFADMQQYFDRAGLRFDYEAKSITGDPNRAPVPHDWLRLPEDSIWSDTFNALETWNGHQMKDSNEDGVRENARLDIVMRDWFNFLSFGLDIAPIGNSDSHTLVNDHVGMPRTYVRVSSDLPTDIEAGTVTDDVLDTLTGVTPRDILMTNGPHITVTAVGDAEFVGSPLGSVVDASAGGEVTLNIRVVAPDWAQVDTIEVFVNATPDTLEKKETWLQPATCFTAVPLAELSEVDPCVLAPIPSTEADISLAGVQGPGGFQRYEGEVSLTLTADDMAVVNRAGAQGSDAWIVIRVRGRRAVFPIMEVDAITADNFDILLTGNATEMDAALQNIGIPATAVTSPIFVDFDGSGYRAPFEP